MNRNQTLVSSAHRRTIWAWALYDFANSPFSALVVTFIYATYFTQAIAPDPISGTEIWSHGITITALVVAFLSPLLGTVADRGGYRKPFLLISTAATVAATVALYPVLPGEVTKALVIFIIANIAFEMGQVFYNAFLPDIAPAGRIGSVSGLGWGLGYVGGLIVLLLSLVTLIQPEIPWFGFSKELGENVRATNLLVALWLAVFSLPIFLFVREDKSAVTRSGSILAASYKQLLRTFRDIRQYKQIVHFLIARLLYNDGLVTIFAFGGIYAAGTFGFTTEKILIFGIVLNVAAGAGAFLFGRFDDKLGGKRTIEVSLWGLSAATLLAIFAQSEALFWIAGIAIGIFVGPNQSASRSLLGRFVPADKENEFFGFFAFSGKATAFVGPLMLGLLTEWFDSQRAGITIVLVLFAAGLLALRGLDEAEGIRQRDRPAIPA